jgi:putative CocE/NonD family hydrolase
LIVKTEFPFAIRVIENTWIPLADGCRLAATIWLPEGAEESPVPAILEYLPYRKDDGRAVRDSTYHLYFAGHGYASIRVDMRGTGASDGILMDEYLPQEQDDALEVLAWIRDQAWCTGAVGIIGISWGGFNGLQIAARRPPQLKAIISACSTDDRYADDVHYRGGCLLAADALAWASHMFVMNGLPPDPELVGERWRDMWLDRLRHTPPYIEAWLSHQTRDAFWKQGSVCENYSDIVCPVYAVGGWADAYTNAIPRLLEGLSGPRKGLIGPWSHNYPHAGVPGPAIGFLKECLRWWDYWLKGIDTGIMDEPMLRVWVQESVRPSPFYHERPGRWVAEMNWPAPDLETQTYWLNDRQLADAPSAEKRVTCQGSQFAGFAAGTWCPYGDPVDLPLDQRAEDGLSLTFDSPPLKEAVDVLGYPELTLSLAADQPNALLAVRLCDVAPSGASTLVSRGFLNLTHRESHEHPQPLEPGQRYTVSVRLDVLAHRIARGHRWRVAVSPTHWPMAWPSPKPVVLSLFTGQGSQFRLPVRPPRAEDDRLPPFGPPEVSESKRFEWKRSPSHQRAIHQDIASQTLQIVDVADGGHQRLLDSGLEFYRRSEDVYTIVEDDPLSAAIRCDRTMGLQRGEWRVRVETASTMSADAAAFYVTNVLDAYEGNTRIFTKTRDFKVPRHWV